MELIHIIIKDENKYLIILYNNKMWILILNYSI